MRPALVVQEGPAHEGPGDAEALAVGVLAAAVGEKALLQDVLVCRGDADQAAGEERRGRSWRAREDEEEGEAHCDCEDAFDCGIYTSARVLCSLFSACEHTRLTQEDPLPAGKPLSSIQLDDSGGEDGGECVSREHPEEEDGNPLG